MEIRAARVCSHDVQGGPRTRNCWVGLLSGGVGAVMDVEETRAHVSEVNRKK